MIFAVCFIMHLVLSYSRKVQLNNLCGAFGNLVAVEVVGDCSGAAGGGGSSKTVMHLHLL